MCLTVVGVVLEAAPGSRQDNEVGEHRGKDEYYQGMPSYAVELYIWLEGPYKRGVGF